MLYLSHYLKQHRSAYYDLLQAVRDRGAWEDWIAFFLRGVADVSEQATETARRILNQREHERNQMAATFGYAAGNGHRVLEHLYTTPIVSVNNIRDLLTVTYPAANQLVDRLVTIGVLQEITGQARNRQFKFASYINLFDEDRKRS